MGITNLDSLTLEEDLVVEGTATIPADIQQLTATGAITVTQGVVLLNHASTVIAATKAAPAVGDMLWIVNNSASGTAAHTVTLATGVTWDGTNDVATFNAPAEALLVVATSATRFQVLVNIGSVGFS